MVDPISSNIARTTGAGATGGGSSIGGSDKPAGASFSDTLKKSIDEVAKLQQDASTAVQNVATGQSNDVSGVMSAVEKSDLAFKTLLAIRAKLMDAYDEVKGIQM